MTTISRVLELPEVLEQDAIYLVLTGSNFRMAATGTADAGLVLHQTRGKIVFDRELAFIADSMPSGNNIIFQFNILNYDDSIDYEVYSESGTIIKHLIGESFDLEYQVTDPSGPQIFEINGQVFEFTLIWNTVNQPTITAPTNNAQNIPLTGQQFETSAFGMQYDPLANWTHEATDWQIATDAGFTNVVHESLNDTTNKTTWTPT